MNKGWKIAIVVFAASFGYVIGNYVPLGLFKPEYSDEVIGKAEYYRLLISIISAAITFCAVIVALFKDDMREYWKRPQIVFSFPSPTTVEHLSSPANSTLGNDTLTSSKYTSRLEVKNIGNLPTLNAEIFLESLKYTAHQSDIIQDIDSPSTALEWIGTELTSIIIPPGGKKYVNIVEIFPPEKISTPETGAVTKPAVLSIGNVDNSKDQPRGKWIATFTLYAQNHKPISFCVVIDWNGQWKTRLTELGNQYQISKFK